MAGHPSAQERLGEGGPRGEPAAGSDQLAECIQAQVRQRLSRGHRLARAKTDRAEKVRLTRVDAGGGLCG